MKYLNKKPWKENLILMSGSSILPQISLMFPSRCLQLLEENTLPDNWFEAEPLPPYIMERPREPSPEEISYTRFKVGLKELRETFNCLRIIKKKSWYQKEPLAALIDEYNQLISIFVKSIETARKNLNKEGSEL